MSISYSLLILFLSALYLIPAIQIGEKAAVEKTEPSALSAEIEEESENAWLKNQFSTDFHEFRTLLDRWEETIVDLATSPAIEAIKPNRRTGKRPKNRLKLAADLWGHKKKEEDGEEKGKSVEEIAEREMREAEVDLIKTLFLEDKQKFDVLLEIAEKVVGAKRLLKHMQVAEIEAPKPVENEFNRKFRPRNILRELFADWNCAEVHAKFAKVQPKKMIIEKEASSEMCKEMELAAAQFLGYMDIMIFFEGILPNSDGNDEAGPSNRAPPNDPRIASLPLLALSKVPIRPNFPYGTGKMDHQPVSFRPVTAMIRTLVDAYTWLLLGRALPSKLKAMRPVDGELHKILMQWQQQFEWMALLPRKNVQAEEASVEVRKRRGKSVFWGKFRSIVHRQKKQQPADDQFCLVFEHRKYIYSNDDLIEKKEQILPDLVGTNIFDEFERRWKHLFFTPAVLMGVASPHHMNPWTWQPPFARVGIAECRRWEAVQAHFPALSAPLQRWEAIVGHVLPELEQELEKLRIRAYGKEYEREKREGFKEEMGIFEDKTNFPWHEFDLSNPSNPDLEHDIWKVREKIDWIHRREKEVDAMRQQIITHLDRNNVPEELEPMDEQFTQNINDILHAYYPRNVQAQVLDDSSRSSSHYESDETQESVRYGKAADEATKSPSPQDDLGVHQQRQDLPADPKIQADTVDERNNAGAQMQYPSHQQQASSDGPNPNDHKPSGTSKGRPLIHLQPKPNKETKIKGTMLASRFLNFDLGSKRLGRKARKKKK